MDRRRRRGCPAHAAARFAYADGSERVAPLQQETVKLTLETLLTFPWIGERVATGRLRLHGAHFDIRSGELSLLGADGAFTVVT